MNIKLPPLATLLSSLGGIAGVVGVILGAVGAGGLAGPVRVTVTAVGGLLAAIAHWHTSSVVATKAKAVPSVSRPPAAS